MTLSQTKRMQFLTDLYTGKPVQRHAVICQPATRPLFGPGNEDYSLSKRPVSEFVPQFVEAYHNAIRYHEAVGDDGVPMTRLSTGTHIFAAAFGSPVHIFADSNPCALPCLTSIEQADSAPEVNVFDSPILMRVFELARLVQNELGRDAMLGTCDMQSGFDTACLVLDKAELFMAMYGTDEEKAAVKRLARKCARTFKQFSVEFRKEFVNVNPCHCPGSWVPPHLGPWLSNDECGAMSTEAFEEFCLPELVDLAQTFGGLGMHCCAEAEHQFPSFKEIPGFYGFNRCPAKLGFEPLLKHFTGKGSPVHTLAWIDEATIARLTQVAPVDTRFAFVLMGEPVDKAIQWCERVRPMCNTQV